MKKSTLWVTNRSIFPIEKYDASLSYFGNTTKQPLLFSDFLATDSFCEVLSILQKAALTKESQHCMAHLKATTLPVMIDIIPYPHHLKLTLYELSAEEILIT